MQVNGSISYSSSSKYILTFMSKGGHSFSCCGSLMVEKGFCIVRGTSMCKAWKKGTANGFFDSNVLLLSTAMPTLWMAVTFSTLYNMECIGGGHSHICSFKGD